MAKQSEDSSYPVVLPQSQVDQMAGGGGGASVTGTPPALSHVAASAISVTLKAANANRLGLTVFNDSASATLFLSPGTTPATTTDFIVKIGPGAYFEYPRPVYTGIIYGIWDAAVGNARIAELT